MVTSVSELRTGDTVIHDGVRYTVTVRHVGDGRYVVSGLTADNCGWFRFVVDVSREFIRAS